jgi:hypothetical protein
MGWWWVEILVGEWGFAEILVFKVEILVGKV